MDIISKIRAQKGKEEQKHGKKRRKKEYLLHILCAKMLWTGAISHKKGELLQPNEGGREAQNRERRKQKVEAQ